MSTRLTLTAVAAATALFFTAPDANAQARSNIKDDPNSSACTENCTDAGYEWAIANTPSDDADCAADNADFAAGCAHWLEEQREGAAPPPEEPSAADAADASAAAADAADAEAAAQAADAAAAEADAAAAAASEASGDADAPAPTDDPPADPPANQ